MSEWVRDWQPFHQSSWDGESPICNAMAGQLNPYNNVGHVFAAYSYLDTPLHKKTIKGGNVSAAAGHNLTQNQDANFENPGYMDAYVGFRIMRQTTWTETPINFTADPEYVTHDHYQQISCEA